MSLATWLCLFVCRLLLKWDDIFSTWLQRMGPKHHEPFLKPNGNLWCFNGVKIAIIQNTAAISLYYGELDCSDTGDSSHTVFLSFFNPPLTLPVYISYYATPKRSNRLVGWHWMYLLTYIYIGWHIQRNCFTIWSYGINTSYKSPFLITYITWII